MTPGRLPPAAGQLTPLRRLARKIPRFLVVVDTIEAARSGTSDEQQLDFAAAQESVLVTFNRGDFARIHATYLSDGRSHAGIIVSRQAVAGSVVRALTKLLASRNASELESTLFWLAID